MAKTFYTEHDIEDMARRGERSLVVSDDVVLTDLAYESAQKLGVDLLQSHDTPPGAPMRPYINQIRPPAATSLPSAASSVGMIKQRVRDAVKARLGDQIDDALLDRIIDRVAAELGLR